ncbi:transglutaminase family protein [Sandaracinobacter neustonicus]|uniref:Transglutaminase family protein n=1 Tax=Sandaracinobacter neustonicus TaxID=1715348 RepID=A0A501XFU8_9SPHN|nr:transglutaminase family protein [Sandaracinobacter neustonicus]TPE59491.1 transglutaminase family protein [Sandaracinobacter neustonicus]
MLIHAGFHIEIDCPADTPLVLMLNVHPDRRGALHTPDQIRATPGVRMRSYRDSFGNICRRLVAPAGRLLLQSDFLIRDSGAPDHVRPHGRQQAVADLPDDVLQFLLPSRYCETEALMPFAWAQFGDVPEGWVRAQAVVDFVHGHIEFGYPHAWAQRTALGAFNDRRGVCRDFAHLAVALCRCLNIPARYVNGYLGDIGVPPVDAPMDFSAWFQVWLDGEWHDFDARHNRPRIGRILIAAGRDAADVAMLTAFGQHSLARFEVTTVEVPPRLHLPQPHQARCALSAETSASGWSAMT